MADINTASELYTQAFEQGRQVGLKQGEGGGTWSEGRYWRIVADDGHTRLESSVEQEARDMMEPGDRLEREWVRKQHKWTDYA